MATTVGDAVFLDTNVLVYASQPAAHHHAAALSALERLEEEGCSLWISSQVVREYLAVVTRAQGQQPGLPVTTAISDVRRLIGLFEVAEERSSILERFLQLVAVHQCAGKQVHDTQLVATMIENGIHRLLTFNRRDFQCFVPAIELEPIDDLDGLPGVGA